jgi:NADPH:quinone reductase-like Zn-dependent oxidoreductase
VPGEDQVLVRVRAAGLDRGVCHVMTGLPYLIRLVVPTLGPRRPKVPVRGMDLAGRVEAVGGRVTRFRPGDEVFGWTDGSYAEYVAVPEDQLAAKPARLSFEQAAAVPRQDDLQTLRGLLQAGRLTPLLDRSFPLAEVPEAIRHLVRGHGPGKIVIAV